MLPDHKVKCPATGFARSCREIVSEHDCPKFVHVQFTNPQTGVAEDKYGCADAFMPLLTIMGIQQTRQAGAAIESFRNEVVKADETAARQRQEAINWIEGPQGARRISG